MANETNCGGGGDGCTSICGFNGSATVTLNLDEGVTQECLAVAIFEAANKKNYIALLPLDENGENHDGEVYLYRFIEENGEPGLDNILDDEEYELASDAFDEWLDSHEFDDLVYEDGEEVSE